MAIEKWNRLSRKVLLKHPRLTIVEDEVELPNGKITKYIRRAPSKIDSAIIIAINDNNEILLQQEYSYPPNQVLWQLPGGALETGEDIISGARRELREESGYDAENSKVIGWYYLDNRRSDTKQHVVVCHDLTKAAAHHDPEEFIESHWVPVDDVKQMVAAGEINNITLLAALNIWFLRT